MDVNANRRTGTNFSEAFKAYDKSTGFYHIAMKKFGMNVVDGLFHLYGRYGWNYVKVEDIKAAVDMFTSRLQLCEQFDLGLKRERALLDLGYHLILLEDYANAAAVLAEHYDFVKQHHLEEQVDQMLLFGGLAFSHWYSGDYLNAVQLMALLVLQFAMRGLRPAVMVMEGSQMDEKLDALKFFRTNAYTFILPKDKGFADFNAWTEEVCKSLPHLKVVLTSFRSFGK